MRKPYRHCSGITLIELIIVGVVTIVIGIAIMSMAKARNTSQQNACVGNLRIIDGGKEQAAMAWRLSDGDSISTVSVNLYIKGATTPICPAGGEYGYRNIGSNPDCSFTTPTSHLFGGS